MDANQGGNLDIRFVFDRTPRRATAYRRNESEAINRRFVHSTYDFLSAWTTVFVHALELAPEAKRVQIMQKPSQPLPALTAHPRLQKMQKQ